MPGRMGEATRPFGMTGLMFWTDGLRHGSFQAWLAPPEQLQIWTWVPGVVEKPVSSRQAPDCGLTSDPLDCGCHTCSPLPLHAYRSTRGALAAETGGSVWHLHTRCHR